MINNTVDYKILSKEYFKLIALYFKQKWLKRQWTYWYFDNKQFLYYIYFQKSNYSNKYYVNIWIYNKYLINEEFPKSYPHISFRLESILNLDQCLNYEISLDIENENNNIDEKVENLKIHLNFVLENLKFLNTKELMKKFLVDNEMNKKAIISLVAKNDLWISFN